MTLVYDIKDTFVHNIRYSRTVTRKTLQLDIYFDYGVEFVKLVDGL